MACTDVMSFRIPTNTIVRAATGLSADSRASTPASLTKPTLISTESGSMCSKRVVIALACVAGVTAWNMSSSWAMYKRNILVPRFSDNGPSKLFALRSYQARTRVFLLCCSRLHVFFAVGWRTLRNHLSCRRSPGAKA